MIFFLVLMKVTAGPEQLNAQFEEKKNFRVGQISVIETGTRFHLPLTRRYA